MPSGNKRDKPRSADLSALLEGLAEAGIRFIMVGGLAAVAQGVPITTLDLDIVHQQSIENIQKLHAFLKKAEAIYRRPDDKRVEPEIQDLSRPGHVLLVTRFGPLDVLGSIEEGRGYEDLLPDTAEIRFRGHKVRILSLELLTELKRRSRDPEDRRRVPLLEETLRQSRSQGDNDL
jgi:uncharacterized protein with von Willebrand factor type A (vWA) domain